MRYRRKWIYSIPNPEFCKYTHGIFLVDKKYPEAIPTALPSFGTITWLFFFSSIGESSSQNTVGNTCKKINFFLFKKIK